MLSDMAYGKLLARTADNLQRQAVEARLRQIDDSSVAAIYRPERRAVQARLAELELDSIQESQRILMELIVNFDNEPGLVERLQTHVVETHRQLKGARRG